MKKTLCLALALVMLLFAAAPAGASSSPYVCFIATNENLLPLTSQAYSQGGQYYVPASVFAQFRVYSSYHSATSTAELTNSVIHLYFNTATGETYDGSSNYYSTKAILLGGSVFVPVDFVCRQFGLSWSYIRGNGYGDVCRITDSSAVLSDSDFFRAARQLMEGRYNEYTGTTSRPEGGDDDRPGGSSVVFLSFQGLPSDTALNTLSSLGVRAAFFLTAGEVAGSPDTVRRIVGEGHNIGALCSAAPAAEFEAFSEALWRAAHTITVLAAAASSEYRAACEAFCESEGLVFSSYSLDGVRGGRGMTVSELNAALSGSWPAIIRLRLMCCQTTYNSLSGIISALRAESVILSACEV